LFIYQGIKGQHLAAELFDMPAFLSAEVVGEGADIQVPNGLRMKVIDPLRHIHMTFSDPVRETEVDVHLTLRRRQLQRPRRSWGELRPEDHTPVPPYNWVTGVPDDGAWAFNVGSLDDPARKPHWLEHYPVPVDKAFKDGWVYRDGRTVRFVHASKRVEREPGSLRPTRTAIEMHDPEGGVIEVTGQIVAGLRKPRGLVQGLEH
jgi:hypothetical protein